MLDIHLIREDKEKVKENLLRRGYNKVNLIDEIYDLDLQWREILSESNQLKKERNQLAKEIGKNKNKTDDSSKQQLTRVKTLKKLISDNDLKEKDLLESRDYKLKTLPNLIQDEVPRGNDESDNVAVKYWGQFKIWKNDFEKLNANDKKDLKDKVIILENQPIHHSDLVVKLNFAELERAGEIAGSRFYFELNEFPLLDLALGLYGVTKLKMKDFKIITPPYLVRAWVEEGATDFGVFEDALYKIEGEDLYLIPTSEHPIAAMNANTTLLSKDLPLKYGGYSPCFRKEASAEDKDTKGIFRVHQFNKVEQYVVSLPEESQQIMDELTVNCEEMLQELNIPYRIVEICTGDMDHKAARQYDIEAWFPTQGRFREIISIGNVTDWQARRLKIKHTEAPTKESFYVHTIYATGLAIQRTLLAIIENHLEDNILAIPEVLTKYLPFSSIKFD
ncbi:MAG: serine--tRNA ligase [Candidatus Heimdallarchaeota archaeon]|nr:serine--tRNA ligase [Candidatus Heimdallarchaeota archaeon]MDH5646851.1 serine--tRNA ligase [Candidatus Heimdallarchaeota archaeon]